MLINKTNQLMDLNIIVLDIDLQNLYNWIDNFLINLILKKFFKKIKPKKKKDSKFIR